MSTQITVTLPENVYQRAQRLSELSGLDVEEIIAQRLDLLLPPLRSEMDTRPVESLSDEEVIAVAKSMMDETLSSRMSTLLQKNGAGTLTDAERGELAMLFDIFEVGQLRKAEAAVEAVNRGLRKFIEP